MENIFVFIIVLVICIIITRWVFSIPTIVEHLKFQSDALKSMNKILAKLAEKNGMTEADIQLIANEINSEESNSQIYNSQAAKHVISKTSIDDAIRNFALFLNDSWYSREVSNRIKSGSQDNEQVLEKWLQEKWKLLVERSVMANNEYLQPYGSDAKNKTKFKYTHSVIVKSRKSNSLIDLLHNETIANISDLMFERLVSLEDGNYIEKPIFDYVVFNDDMNRQRVFNLNDIVFELKRI